ncbi:hypothetical protein MBLNU457_4634t1 [Dothideomycetes sp. NU457]
MYYSSMLIHEPPHHVSAIGARPPIIIYLPPGPILPTTSLQNDEAVAHSLASQTAATVVEVKYRLNKDLRWPNPIHDVLFGYDWVLRNLVPQRSITRPGRSPSHDVRIGVFGELIGGGLAAMLALTECHVAGPRVAAAVLNEPIVDWVFPEDAGDENASEEEDQTRDSIPTKSSKRSKRPSSFQVNVGGPISPSTLLQARRTLFQKPEHYFDPFASPTLFFRSPGVPIPPGSFDEPLDEFAELARAEQDDFYRQQMRLSAMSGLSLSDPSESSVTTTVKTATRKSSRRYPRVGSGLKLPPFLLSCAQTSPLLDQVQEFSSLMVRSRVRDIEAEGSEMEREHAIEHAERDIVCDLKADSSKLWTTGARSLSTAVDWFRRHL